MSLLHSNFKDVYMYDLVSLCDMLCFLIGKEVDEILMSKWVSVYPYMYTKQIDFVSFSDFKEKHKPLKKSSDEEKHKARKKAEEIRKKVANK